MIKKLFFLLLVIIIQNDLNSIVHAQELIDYGFVFVDGRYVEAPYKVTMKKLSIYINGIEVVHRNPEPQPDMRVLKDPGEPKGLTREMGISAINDVRDSTGYPIIFRKLSYFFQNFPKKEADEKATEFLNTLPFIKTFRLNDIHGTIYLEDYSNKSENILISREHPLPPLSFEKRTELANEFRSTFENNLKNGDCYIISKKSGLTHIGGVHVARIFQKVIDALSNPSLSIDKKKEVLDSCIIYRKNDRNSEELINNFIPNKVLNEKINDNVKFIKEKYGTEILRPQIQRKGEEKKLLNKKSSIIKINDLSTAYSPDGNYYYLFCSDAFWDDYVPTINANICNTLSSTVYNISEHC